MATRFPVPEDLAVPSIQGRPGLVGPDRSGSIIAEGVGDLAGGLSTAAQALHQRHLQDLKEQNTADLAAAESAYLTGALELENSFDQRNDWTSFEADAKGGIFSLKEKAAALIRDPKMRASWLADADLKSISFVDNIGDKARSGIKADNQVKLETSLMQNARLAEDPTVAPDVRAQAVIDMQGTLMRALDTATITTDQAALWRDKYLDGAEENFQINTARLEMQRDPELVKIKTGIPAAVAGQELGQAVVLTNGGPLVFSPELADMAARVLKDTALPTDLEMRKAYLSDPEINAKYAMAAVDALTAKYGGDITAAVIALAPGSDDAMVKAWIDSKHDEGKLPKAVKDFYRATMNGIKAPANVTHINALAEPGVMIEEINPEMLDRWETVQSMFGQQLTIISAKRNPNHKEMGGDVGLMHTEGEAVDIDTSGLSEEDLVRLIRTASAAGISGIALEGSHLHLDMGPRRAVGPDGTAESIPSEYADLAMEHVKGAIREVPASVSNVDPSMSKVSYDNRQRIFAEAQQEADRQRIEKRAGIEIAADNAPAAVSQFGEYDGYTPTAEDFVDAYGGAVGIEKYKAFKFSMDVASNSFSMKTMSATQISDLLASKVPSNTGDMATYETQRYAALTQAAKAVVEAREADPAGATMEAFPALQEAAKSFGTSPEASSAFLKAMAEAQAQLGITKQALLPKSIVGSMIAGYKDTTKPIEERAGPMIQTVFQTEDAGQRRALAQQFIDAGMPNYLGTVLDAFERNDERGGQYLLRAMAVDPKMIPKDLGVKQAEIDEAVGKVFFAQGSIGSMRYGLSGAPTDRNLPRAFDDNELFTTAVKLRLAEGTKLNDAVRLTAEDMWGNVKAAQKAGNIEYAGMSVMIPGDKDPDRYQKGFTMLLPTVAEAMTDTLNKAIAGRSDTSMFEYDVMVRDNEVKQNLMNGRFVNAGDGVYQFQNMDGYAITDADGKPLTFTDAEVEAAAAEYEVNVPNRMEELNSTLPVPFGPGVP